jgi:hypothetical protein
MLHPNIMDCRRRFHRDGLCPRGFCIGKGAIWLGALAIGGCIRFAGDVPVDASLDASLDGSNDVSADAIAMAEAGSRGDAPDTSTEGGDAPAKPTDASVDVVPTCQRFDPSIAQAAAGDVVSLLLQDCRIRSAFTSLPPVRLQHLEECLGAQIASVLGCVHPDGTRFKYPAFDSKGQFCRDMKTAHGGLAASDGDFDAFLAAIAGALAKNGLTDDEMTRALRSFGAGSTRADIVKLKEAGPTQPCDAGVDAGRDATADANPDASADVSLDASDETRSDAAARDGAIDGSTD